MGKLWLLEPIFGDKSDYIDVRMIDNIHKPCLSLNSGFFPLVKWFVNLSLTDTHGAKKL